MPFTPLHMGPGIAIKAALRRRFSLMVFGWSQIVMHLQPLFVMLTDKGDIHGFSHTVLGATLLGLAAALSGKPLGELGLRLLREPAHLPITWPVSFLSACIGTYSHVLIDSIMHSDIAPFAPWRGGSPQHGVISIDTLHLLCVATAVVGGAVYYLPHRTESHG